jgi:maltase-glucoamylase
MMIGSGLLLTPVYKENAVTVSGYFPQARWFNYFDGAELSPGNQVLTAPLDFLNIHLRGGFILPTQQPGMTTAASKTNPFGLTVALNENKAANGELYLDDGETIVKFVGDTFAYLTFEATSNEQSLKIAANVIKAGFGQSLTLSEVKVAGMAGLHVSSVVVNGNQAKFAWSANFLSITSDVPIISNFVILITY